MYASVNYFNTGEDNSLLPEWCPAIILASADVMSVGSWGKGFVKF